jgi:uncharacterized protein
MTSLRERFTEAMKEAMKAGEKARLLTIRLMISELKNKDVEARGLGKGQAGDDDILGMLQKMIKQRQDSIAMFDQGGRPELAAAEREEIAVITTFLPKQMDDGDVDAVIDALIAETGATSIKEMGKVIGAMKAKYSGQMDFGKASARVKAKLGG